MTEIFCNRGRRFHVQKHEYPFFFNRMMLFPQEKIAQCAHTNAPVIVIAIFSIAEGTKILIWILDDEMYDLSNHSSQGQNMDFTYNLN